MADRLKSLRRIAAVQSEMIKHTQWRLSASVRACGELAADAKRLRAFVGDDDQCGALELRLARVAQKSIGALDRRLAAAERDRGEQQAKLDILRRRERVMQSVTRRAATDERREQEARELETLLDAWLASTLDRQRQ